MARTYSLSDLGGTFKADDEIRIKARSLAQKDEIVQRLHQEFMAASEQVSKLRGEQQTLIQELSNQLLANYKILGIPERDTLMREFQAIVRKVVATQEAVKEIVEDENGLPTPHPNQQIQTTLEQAKENLSGLFLLTQQAQRNEADELEGLHRRARSSVEFANVKAIYLKEKENNQALKLAQTQLEIAYEKLHKKEAEVIKKFFTLLKDEKVMDF